MTTAVTNTFEETLARYEVHHHRLALETLQVNLGMLCNQACKHCHVDAGPARTETMKAGTVSRIIQLLSDSETIHTVDITGGAPELNPHFRQLVSAARSLGKKVIDRCNLTVLLEKGQQDTPRFLRDNQVQITASMPCYSLGNVDKQRGTGTFDKSIEALHVLNRLGYGREPGLELNLVYNPGGASLPPDQKRLEADYKRELQSHFGIVFNNLFTITNMPIQRFRESLLRTGKLTEYEELLQTKFNPHAAEGIMCRSLISIGWDGFIYDCDFNQMLDIPVGFQRSHINSIESFDELAKRPIAFADHCFGCTAGAGSSCGGILT